MRRAAPKNSGELSMSLAEEERAPVGPAADDAPRPSRPAPTAASDRKSVV